MVAAPAQGILGGLASAFLSIALALTVTELLLKPIFARDLIRLAQLKRRIDDIGLNDLAAESRIPWDVEYGGGDNLELVVLQPRYWLERDLGRLLARGASRDLTVDVSFPEPGEVSRTAALALGVDPESYRREVESVANDLEQAWKTLDESRRPLLRIHWITSPPSGFFFASSRTYIVGIQPGVRAPGLQPLYLHVSRGPTSDVSEWLRSVASRHVAARLELPVWTSRNETGR